MKRNERAVLIERQALSSDAFLLVFDSPRLSRDILPGQFTMLRTRASDLLLRRPYSFCAWEPEQGRFSLLVKVVGAGTRSLAELPLGGSVECLGPLGTSFRLPEPDRRPVIVAGGVGIAPFVSLCRELAKRGRCAIVLLGGRSEPDLYLKEHFRELGMDVRCATEDGSYGHSGMVTELLEPLVSEEAPSGVRLYSCGPSAMMERSARWARGHGIPHQVSVERRMGCGMGCCWGCVVFTRTAGQRVGEYRRSCTEGPVFDAEEIVWEKDPMPL